MHSNFKWQHLALALAGLVLLAWSAPGPAQPALHDVARLRQQVAGFAGGPARLDPALVVPRCPDPALSWARSDVVRVDCAAPAWTLYVPIDQPAGSSAARAAPARPAIRRGDRVMVEAGGAGFAVTLEAEAERDADGTRIALKTPAGRRLIGRIEDGGRVVIPR
jgi:flagella basal body P-ring formation protein FlgA